jgi:hypothetical protein
MKVSCLVFRDSVQTVPLGRFFFVALPRIGETVVLASHPNDRFDVLESYTQELRERIAR